MDDNKFPEPKEGTVIPRNIGIIMDGNGRWAKKRGLLRFYGHKQGAKTFRNICKYCNKIGVKVLTVYAFSTENWKRPQKEIDAIMDLLRDYLADVENNKDENIVTRFIGEISAFDADIIDGIKHTEEMSKDFTGMVLNIAVNYGGRDEIIRGVKNACFDILTNKISLDEINEEEFEKYLYTAGQPNVDLIIRPSGEMRLSNFLIWQSVYAEFVFRDVLWPDFKPADMLECIYEYNKRNRRFGGI